MRHLQTPLPGFAVYGVQLRVSQSRHCWHLGPGNTLFLAVLGLPCCSGFSLVAASRGYSLIAMQRFLIVVASLAAERRLWGAQASVVAAPGL